MKKKSIKNLHLNKRSISTLRGLTKIKGGFTDWPETAKLCPVPAPQEPEPEPAGPIELEYTEWPHICIIMTNFPGCL